MSADKSPCTYEGCGKDEIGRFSPDLDIHGLGFCADHKDKVEMAYTVLVTSGDEALCNQLLGRKKRNNAPKAAQEK